MRGPHPVVPVHDEETDRWGMDLILYYENVRGDTFGKKSYTPEEIERKKWELAQISGQPIENMKTFQYRWWGDKKEPVIFR